MTRTERRLQALEAQLLPKEEIRSVIIYDPDDPEEPEKSLAEFEAKYPEYCNDENNVIFIIPDNKRD